MAHTKIDIRDRMGSRVPSLDRIPVVAGDTVTFTSADADSALYFSPDLLSILEPHPDAATTLTTGLDLTCTFTNASAGNHQIIFLAPEADAPEAFIPALDSSSVVMLLVGQATSFPVTTNPIQTLQASVQPHGFMAKADGEDLSITTNPIQT